MRGGREVLTRCFKNNATCFARKSILLFSFKQVLAGIYMHQIIGLRSLGKGGGKADNTKLFALPPNADLSSVEAILTSAKELVHMLPASERYNLFFTPCATGPEIRSFQSTSVIWFDFDKIDLEHLEKYIELFCSTLHLSREQTGIVCSGRGLHFYVGLKKPIVEPDFFSRTKDHYKAVLDRVSNAWHEAELPHGLDPSVYNGRQIMRLPFAENRKPGKTPVMPYVINAKIKAVDFDLPTLSGIPLVNADDQIDAKSFRKLEPTAAPVFQGCEFLKWVKGNPAQVAEPEWYAALSITARLKEGAKESHEMSSGHPGYSKKDTDKKIEQALRQSGPRTCTSINQLWGQCGTCPNFNQVTSPILIKDPDEITTKDTGFHHFRYNPKTKAMQMGDPDYIGLAKFFAQTEGMYHSTEETVWVFNGTHYVQRTDSEIKAFAQAHFDPPANINMAREFLELLYRTHVWTMDEWEARRKDCVNFTNGVLDLETEKLSPHSPDYALKNVRPYPYDPKAKAPVFLKFLDDITQGNKVYADTLLEFGGYALSGAPCAYEKALMLVGEGSNGKSTFIDVLKAVAGPKSYSALPIKEISEREARSALDSSLFNITEETPSKMWDGETFKNLVTGGEVTSRKLYHDSYTFRNRAKLILLCNKLPEVSDFSEGFFRRCLIVPFNAHFSKKAGNADLFIGKKLEAELPGILNLFLEGWKRLKARGMFTKQFEVEDKEVSEYKENVNHVLYWKNEKLRIDPEAFISNDDLYRGYRAFCDEAGFDKRYLAKNAFFKELSRLMPDLGKSSFKKIEGKSARGYKGITLEIHDDKEF